MRVLTSVESIALLEEKIHKKREEQKKERTKEKRERIKEGCQGRRKEWKAQERQSKQAEKQKKTGQSKFRWQKRNDSSEGSTSKWQRLDREEDGVQNREVSQNKCAACFGWSCWMDWMHQWGLSSTESCRLSRVVRQCLCLCSVSSLACLVTDCVHVQHVASDIDQLHSCLIHVLGLTLFLLFDCL